MPVKQFWLLNKNINRLQAEQDSRTFNLLLTAQSQDPESVRATQQSLKEENGTVVIEVGGADTDQLDRAGLARLKALS